MNKNIRLIIICFVILISISCNFHTHEYVVKYDENQHYKECACGDKIDVIEHNFKDQNITKNPTCTEEGIKIKECNDCDYKQEEKIEMLEHDCEINIIKESTCIEEGLKEVKCRNCNYYKEKIIEKLEHNYSEVYNYDETIHYKECECGEKTEISEHSYEWVIDVDSTDLLIGYKHQECTICKSIINELTEIETKCPYEQIDDKEIIKKLIGIQLDYSIGGYGFCIDYTYLWDGVHCKVKDGLLKGEISKENCGRGYTYLTEYLEKSNDYYLIYVKKNYINENKDKLDEGKNYIRDFYEACLFSDPNEINKIDGKYLYCFRKVDYTEEDVKVFKTNNLDEIKLYLDDYQLVLCAESKEILVKENVSTGEKLDCTKLMFKRKLIEIGENEYFLKEYSVEVDESIEMIDENDFDYVGEMLEFHYEKYYINEKYLIFPVSKHNYFYFGFETAKVLTLENERYVLLPRYTKGGSDLLEENDYENIDMNIMIFGDYKEEFKKAFYKITDEVLSSCIMGLYKYEDVTDVIKSNWFDNH